MAALSEKTRVAAVDGHGLATLLVEPPEGTPLSRREILWIGSSCGATFLANTTDIA